MLFLCFKYHYTMECHKQAVNAGPMSSTIDTTLHATFHMELKASIIELQCHLLPWGDNLCRNHSGREGARKKISQ